MTDHSEARSYAEKCRKKGQKIVFTNGCFDIIHAGHVDYLTKSAQMGDIFIIGLNSDSSVRRLKGDSRPLNDENARKKVLMAIKGVDNVFLFEEDTPYALIKAIKPDILVKGGDYEIRDIVGADLVRENGGKVAVIPFLDGYSTTSLIERIIESEKD